MKHAYECWAERAGGVCRAACSCRCHWKNQPDGDPDFPGGIGCSICDTLWATHESVSAHEAEVHWGSTASAAELQEFIEREGEPDLCSCGAGYVGHDQHDGEDLASIRYRASVVVARPAADGRYYGLENRAVRDRELLLDMLVGDAALRLVLEPLTRHRVERVRVMAQDLGNEFGLWDDPEDPR